jgi:hypothetical protein
MILAVLRIGYRVYILSMICYKYIMDLTTDGVVITNDIRFVQNSKEKLIMSNRGQGVKRTGL